MDPRSPATLKALCARAGIRPQRAAGQHFLAHARTLERIVAAVDPQPGDTVLEVGAGFGVLTIALAAKLKDGAPENGALRDTTDKVIAIERDRRVVPILREIVAPYGNVEVVDGDVLAMLRARSRMSLRGAERRGNLGRVQEWTGLLRLRPRNDESGTWKLVANLPYGITSDFLHLLFDAVGTGALPTPERAVLLLQREVVDRMLGRPGAVGFLTILTALHATPRRIARVPAAHFWPAPKVESAVVALEEFRTPEEIRESLGGIAREDFLRFVRSAYVHPRRQLVRNLRTVTSRSGSDIAAQLAAIGIAPTVRPDRLTWPQWAAVARALR